MCGWCVWLVELPSSSMMYWKVPRLIVKKTNRLTQAVVFFRRHFLCGAFLCNCSPAEREVYLHMYNGNVSRTYYAQNPVFEIVREGSVKVYLHMHNGNVQQNPPCVDSCVTKEISISPQLSPTMFDPDANSVLLRAHLCTAVDFMCRKLCVRNCSRERKGLYNNGNVILTTHLCTAALCAESYVRNCS